MSQVLLGRASSRSISFITGHGARAPRGPIQMLSYHEDVSSEGRCQGPSYACGRAPPRHAGPRAQHSQASHCTSSGTHLLLFPHRLWPSGAVMSRAIMGGFPIVQ